MTFNFTMGKKFVLAICILLCSHYASSQQEPTLDDALQNVDQSTVTSGIIYERVAQFANLYNFNRHDSLNTADYAYFKQALSEMYRASNEQLFVSNRHLDSLVQLEQSNIVPVGILNTNFQLMNYRFEDVQNGGLTYDEQTQEFSQISGEPPFYTLHTTVIAPLDKAIAGTGVTYKIDPAYLFQNQQQKIKTLTADFGDGVNHTLINNQQLTSQLINVPYSTDGVKTSTFCC